MKKFTQLIVLALGTIGLWSAAIQGRAVLAAEAAASGQRISYQVDPTQGRFVVRVFSGGMLRMFGHDHTISIKDFSGSVEIVSPSLEQSSLRLKVKANSLAVSDAGVSAKDRTEIENTMRKQVLDVERFPEILFTSTRVTATKISENDYQVSLEGRLQLHGVTRTETIPVRVTVDGKDLHARGEFPLRQSNYGIKPVAAAGGTVKVKNEIKLTFDLVGIRRK